MIYSFFIYTKAVSNTIFLVFPYLFRPTLIFLGSVTLEKDTYNFP